MTGLSSVSHGGVCFEGVFCASQNIHRRIEIDSVQTQNHKHAKLPLQLMMTMTTTTTTTMMMMIAFIKRYKTSSLYSILCPVTINDQFSISVSK